SSNISGVTEKQTPCPHWTWRSKLWMPARSEQAIAYPYGPKIYFLGGAFVLAQFAQPVFVAQVSPEVADVKSEAAGYGPCLVFVLAEFWDLCQGVADIFINNK